MKENNSSLLALSRRQFLFGSACGAITLLGTTSTKSGFVAAYADEAGNTSFEIVVVGRGDVAIMAIDPSTNTPLSDMEVTITSYAEEATERAITATTNQGGIAVVNARYLSENWSDETPLSGYGFWASVEASKAGYRDFATSVARIQTGPGAQTESGGRQANLTIASQPFASQTDLGYVRRLSFNGFDIQYFTSSFCACAGNRAQHTLEIEIVAAPGSQVEARFFYDGGELASASGTVEADSRAHLKMSGQWLNSIEAGKKAQVFFSINGTEFEVPCNLILYSAADGIEEYSQGEGSLQVGEDKNPFREDGTNVGAYKIKLPEKFPVWGGTYVDLPLPEWPILFQFDPTGSVQLGVTLNLLPLIPKLKEQKWIGNSNWDVLRTESWSEMRDRQIEDECTAMRRYTDAKYISEGGSKEGSQTKFGGKVNLTFSASLVAQADWQWGSNIWSGSGNTQIVMGGKYELGNVAVVGGIPIYYGFDVSLMCTTTFTLAFQTESGFRNFGWAPDKVGFTVVPRFEVGLQFGVGIKGIGSVGLRGYGYLEFTAGFVRTEKAFPHYKLESNMILTIVVNVLFASFTVSVWHLFDEDNPRHIIYDNWEGDSVFEPTQAGQIPRALHNSRATYILQDGKTLDLSQLEPALITNEDLLKLCEFSAKAKEVTDGGGSRDLQMDLTYRQPSFEYPKISGFGIVPSGGLLTSTNYKSSLGVVPAVDECILENVSSDSRQKIVKTSDGSTYLFRLGIVDINGLAASQGDSYIKFNEATGLFEEKDTPLTDEEKSVAFSVPRSRILMSKLTSAGKWSNPEVIDFYIKNESQARFRLNCNDYDFAVSECTGNAGVFFFNVVSSQVLETSKDNFEDRWANQFVTMFQYDSNKTGTEALVMGKVLKPETGISRYCPSANYRRSTSSVFFSFLEAHIDGQEATYSLVTNMYEVGAVSWTEPKATTTTKAFSGQKTSFYQSFKATKGPLWEDTTASMTGITWAGPALNNAGYQVFFQAYVNSSQDLLPGTDYTYQNVAEPILVPEKGWIVVDLDEGDSEQPDRRELTFNSMSKKTNLIYQQKVGIANMTAFTPSSDGSRLFAVHTLDGESSEVKRYQVFAADWDSARESYHEFYPFCQASHPLDQVETAVMGSGLASFITTEITDAEAGAANIHQMNVPLVASVQLESVACTDVFAGVGDTCHAVVCVQNNGNLPLKAFTVKLYDNEAGTGTPLSTKVLNDLSAQLCNSIFDYQGEDERGNSIFMRDEAWLAQKNGSLNTYGKLDNDDLNTLLWPGDERTYQGIEFTVPDTWEGRGTVQVYAFVSDPVADDTRVQDIKASASPNLEEAAKVASLATNAIDFDVAGTVQPDASGVFHDADARPETFEVNLQSQLTADSNLHPANYTSATSGTGIPKTGDDAGNFCAPLALLGAGAAAMAAYSKRRAENEKGKHAL